MPDELEKNGQPDPEGNAGAGAPQDPPETEPTAEEDTEFDAGWDAAGDPEGEGGERVESREPDAGGKEGDSPPVETKGEQEEGSDPPPPSETEDPPQGTDAARLAEMEAELQTLRSENGRLTGWLNEAPGARRARGRGRSARRRCEPGDRHRAPVPAVRGGTSRA